jgi:putative ABC transport system ATP-binding protein
MVTHDPDLARRAHRNVQIIDGQVTDYKPYEGPYEPSAIIGVTGERASG